MNELATVRKQMERALAALEELGRLIVQARARALCETLVALSRA